MQELRVIHLQTIDSTSDYAKKYVLHNNVVQDTLVLSDTQTCGRGRLNGRLWESPLGNFYGTFIFLSDTFICSVDPRTVVLHAIKSYLEEINKTVNVNISAAIKQPNDILVGGKKISGVLIENDGDYIFIGIGINLTKSPIATSTDILTEYGVTLNNTDVCVALHKKIRDEVRNFCGTGADINTY